MDARVKPAHDDTRVSRALPHDNKSIKCGINGMSAAGIG
jgi:hypothetical protein